MDNKNDRNIHDEILSKYKVFSNGEKKVAKYVMDHYSQIVLLSSAELAELSGVSDTTVIRFTKVLGFKGYLEFKKFLRVKIDTTRNPYDFLKKMESKFDSLFIQNYLSTLQEDINNFIRTIDYKEFDDISTSLLNASNVYLVGMGSDAVVAKFLHNYLGLMDINTICVESEGLTLKESLYRLNSKDVIVMSSYPRILKDEKWVATFCKTRDAKLISITDSSITAAYLESDAYVIAKETNEIFFNSYVLPLIFCNILLLSLYEKAPERVEGALRNYSELLGDEEA